MAKEAEESLRKILKELNYYWHKYGDVRYCPYCHHTLPKTENAPDFITAQVFTYIEAKNSDHTGTWRWVEIGEDGERKNQRAWLIAHQGWLYIVLGKGRAPKEKSAFLIPFEDWLAKIEPILIANGQKSIRLETIGKRPGARELLADYQLEWNKGSWHIPKEHVWFHDLDTKIRSYYDTRE